MSTGTAEAVRPAKFSRMEKDPALNRMIAGMFGGRRARAKAKPPNQQAKDVVAAGREKARRTCASQYWIDTVVTHGDSRYSPNQHCLCPQCVADSPTTKQSASAGRLEIRGRLWPRQAAAILGCHYECRQLQLAPPPPKERKPKWKPSKDGNGWCAGERGCWRRHLWAADPKVFPHEVRCRHGRKLIGIDETTVSRGTLDDPNIFKVGYQQIDNPILLAEMNDICEYGEDSGLLDVFPETGHASVKREVSR